MKIRKVQYSVMTAVLLAIGAILPSVGAAQNLVVNGGFEAGVNDWGRFDTKIFDVKTGDAAEGQHFLAMTCPDNKDHGLRRVITGLTAGEQYTLRFKVRKNTSGDFRVILRNPETKAYIKVLKPLPSDGWTDGVATFSVPGTDVSLEISIRAPGSCEVDAFSISSGSDPAPANTPAAKETEPFGNEIATFEAFDKVSPPPQGAVLFVGSSTIRKWTTLAKAFPEVTVINRGFGGAKMEHVLRYVDRIVLPYKAKHIVVYAGDNDLAAKAAPDDVLKNFKAFVEKVHAAQPNTPITYVSIKPSLKRMPIADKMAEANRLIEAFIKTDPKLGYVDATATVLGPDGKPDSALFESDNLHLNQAGYDKFMVPIRARVLALK